MMYCKNIFMNICPRGPNRMTDAHTHTRTMEATNWVQYPIFRIKSLLKNTRTSKSFGQLLPKYNLLVDSYKIARDGLVRAAISLV